MLAAAAVVSNLGPLEDGGALLRKGTQQRLGSLSALQLSRSIVRPGRSVGSVMGQGIPDVHHSEQTGCRRDLLPL